MSFNSYPHNSETRGENDLLMDPVFVSFPRAQTCFDRRLGALLRPSRTLSSFYVSAALLCCLVGVLSFVDLGQGAVASQTEVVKEDSRVGRVRLKEVAGSVGIVLSVESDDVIDPKVLQGHTAKKSVVKSKASVVSSSQKVKAKAFNRGSVGASDRAVPPSKPVLSGGETLPLRKPSLGENKGIADILLIAYRDLQSGNYAGALRGYESVLSQDVNNKKALVGKAYVLEQSGVHSALADLDIMDRTHPDVPQIKASLARLWTRYGEIANAIALWEEALVLDPSNQVYLLSLAVLYDREGLSLEALQTYGQLKEPVSEETRQRIEYLNYRLGLES